MSAPLRIWLVGFGTVGRWVARALLRGPAPPISVVGIATARDGCVTDPAGLDLGAALALREAGRPLAELPGATRHADALAGMRAGDADALVEVGLSPATDGQPGLAHIREALERGIAVVTSNKWPVALAGVELVALAEANATSFRAESTVMSGTPVLGPLTEGLAGARPRAVRGVLNATNNFILSRIAAGAGYEEALAEAQALGLAEPDPSADVDGFDTASKLMVLSALVLGAPLALDRIERRGISELASDELAAARSAGNALREVASVALAEDGEPVALCGPMVLDSGDPLAAVDGTTNAVLCEVEPLGTVTITGPGAGLELAGQGVLSDLLRATSSSARRAAT